MGLLGQTRQAYLPLESFLKDEEEAVEEDEAEDADERMRSSTLRFRFCASLAQLSPPNALIFNTALALWIEPRGALGVERERERDVGGEGNGEGGVG